MLCPKRNSEERHIIADLSYPQQSSVNAYIMKNAVWGEARSHALPTVSEFVDRVKELGPGSYMSTVDISRAYKNFRSDPLDWPLLCAFWDQHYYCDVTLPFGARASSYHMQSVANALVYILEQQGVVACIYLDDIVIPPATPSKHLVVDASLSGIGCSDGHRAYGAQVGGNHQLARNISEIEAINIAVALHTLVDSSYRGAHVRINCDYI